MADEDFGDAELWAAIDTAAARYAPPPAAAAAASPQSRSLVLARFQQQQTHHRHHSPLVELPPSPQPEGPGFSSRITHQQQQQQQQIQQHRMLSSAQNAGSGLKRQQQMVQFHDDPVPLRHKLNSAQHRYPSADRSPLQGLPCTDLDANVNNSALSPWVSGIPSSNLFKQLQDAAMRVLEKGDYLVMQGKPFIRKSGWRKLAFFFNISFEIKDRKIDFDQNGSVQRAEFVIRATMQSGRFSDGWGSCDLREKRFSKPNHDIPSTAETRAKTRSCQDLLGIGEYKGSAENW